MKTSLIMIIASILAIVAFGFFVNNPFKKSDVNLSVLIDKTDSFKAIPDVNEIFSLLNIDDNKWSNITIQVNTLSNFEYNNSKAITLPSQFLLFSNPEQRDSAIAQFKKDFANKLSTINHTPIGRPNSSIYIPLVRELNRVAQSKAKTEVAICYSDLRENTKLFSAYNKRDIILLKTHPEEIQKLFLPLEKPVNLNHVKVYLIFEPKGDAESESFNLMSALMKKIFEDAGAEVYIGANLPPTITNNRE